MPPCTWPSHCARFMIRPTFLRGGDLDDADEAERGVDVAHRPVGGEAERHVRVALAGLGIQRGRGPVVVLDRLLHRVRLVQLVQARAHGLAGQANGAAGHPALP